MSDPTSPSALPTGQLRVGDVERTSALTALGEHLTAGRISLDEYGDRSARISVARTVDDLTAQFDDLPAPHPVLPIAGTAPTVTPPGGTPPSVARTVPAPARRGIRREDSRTVPQRVLAALAAVSVLTAIVLFLTVGGWWWFLLIPGLPMIGRALYGPHWDDWRTEEQRQADRERKLERREEHRQRELDRRDHERDHGGDQHD